jgi:lipopolysaccharide export system protein LptC
MHNGALVVVTAATAMYQSQAQLLDLFGDVNLVHENGTRFVTNTAHVDVAADSVAGNDPVTGHGPSGDITAQGFRVLDRGNTIVFTGNSNLLLKGTKPEAIVPGTIAPETPVAANPLAGPAPTTAAAKPDPVVRSHSVAKRDAKPPSAKAPVGVRVKPDAG